MIKKTFIKIDCKYYVIPANKYNNGMVICKGTVKTNTDYFKKAYPMFNIFLNPPTKVFKGVATCNLEDTFNEKIGKQIALSKVKKKAYASMQNYYASIYYKLRAAIIDVDFVFTNNLKAELNEDKHLKYLLNNGN